MKKSILTLLGAGLLLTSCQSDEPFAPVEGGEKQVTFTLNVPGELGTRAASGESGAQNNQNANIYYTLVLDANGDKRVLQETTTEKTVTFTTPVVLGRKYDITAYASYTNNIDANASNIKAIPVEKSFNDETKDAYTAHVEDHDFALNALPAMQLKRPFGKLRLIATDYVETGEAKNTKIDQVTVTYNNTTVTTYDATTAFFNNVGTGITATKDFVKYYDAESEGMPIFADYLPANGEGQDNPITFTVTVRYAESTETYSRTFNDIPVRRNALTTLKGNFFTAGAEIKVEVKDNFDGGEELIKFVSVATASQLQEAINNGSDGETIILTDDINLNDLIGPNQAPTRSASDAKTLIIKEGTNRIIDLNGYTLSANTAKTGNCDMMLVKGDLTVKNGTIRYQYTGENQEWNAMTTIFDVTAGGVVNLEGVTAMNLGGTDMAFVAHLNNWGKVTLNVNNSTLKSTYIAVRAFNSGNDMNNVTIKNSTLEGKYCFWVHNFKAAGDSNGSEETLNIDIFDGTNTFSYTGKAPVLYGFDNPIYFDKDGYSDDNGNVTIVAAAGLKKLASQVNEGTTFKSKTVKLLGNIDLNGEKWTPIGTSANPFKGTFDGNRHTIKNLVIDGGSKSDIGLFGYTTEGEIKNLTVENAKVKGRLDVGVVAGTPYTSKYTNITVKGHVEVNGMAYVGGVAGKNAYANWTNITVNVDGTSYVNANSVENGKAYRTYVGGVVGFNGEGGHTFKNITSNIDVMGSTCDVGGLFGIAHYGNKFESCVCTGDVEIYAASEEADAQEIGGIAGVWHNETGTTVTMTKCNFTGQLKANNNYVINTTKFGNLVCAAYNTTGTGKLIIDGTEYSALYGALTPVKTADELVAALAGGKGVYLLNDITMVATKGGYNMAGILQNKAQTIDGGGHTLTVTGAGATWDCAIYTNGGIIRNLTVAGAMRGIFTAGQSSDLFIDNVVFKNVVYTFNSDGNMPANPFGVYFTKSTINGWTSHSNMHTEVVYKNCSFGEGSGYKYCRPYGKTVFENCTFCPDYTVDQSQTTEITFTDCTWE